jgi:single-strand DNA-binding protein
MNVNKVFIGGNLTRDIELRHLPGGQAVGQFGIAINRTFKKSDGSKGEEVCFVDCEAWGKTAEIMAQYLGKGGRVFVEGRLKLETWEDKGGGGKRSKMKVVVDNFQFVDRAERGGEQAPAARPTKRPPPASVDFDDESVPF